jgi:hypothetical protein
MPSIATRKSIPIAAQNEKTIPIQGVISNKDVETFGQILETLRIEEDKFVGMLVEAACNQWRVEGSLKLPLRFAR